MKAFDLGPMCFSKIHANFQNASVYATTLANQVSKLGSGMKYLVVVLVVLLARIPFIEAAGSVAKVSKNCYVGLSQLAGRV